MAVGKSQSLKQTTTSRHMQTVSVLLTKLLVKNSHATVLNTGCHENACALSLAKTKYVSPHIRYNTAVKTYHTKIR